MTDQELDTLASSIVRTNEDRTKNYIQVGEDRVALESQPTLEAAKAQWADAHWIVKQLVKLGLK